MLLVYRKISSYWSSRQWLWFLVVYTLGVACTVWHILSGPDLMNAPLAAGATKRVYPGRGPFSQPGGGR